MIETKYGDVDLEGDVDIDDFAVITGANWGQTSGMLWADGDVDGVGGVPDGDMFANGELGMITTGTWMFPTFDAAEFDWDVVVEPGNVQGGSHFFAEGVGVSSASDKQDAAYRWLRFFTSSDEAAQIRVDASWALPTLTDEALFYPPSVGVPAERLESNVQAIFDVFGSG